MDVGVTSLPHPMAWLCSLSNQQVVTNNKEEQGWVGGRVDLKVALYGLSNVKDERLHRLFRANKVQ